MLHPTMKIQAVEIKEAQLLITMSNFLWLSFYWKRYYTTSRPHKVVPYVSLRSHNMKHETLHSARKDFVLKKTHICSCCVL